MARAKAEAPPGASYRIKELADRSKFSRQTIRFYIAQGLLPEPIKTSHNMGWYSERHLELLLLIQKLQHERFLPLKAIKSLLQGSDDYQFSDAQTDVLEELRRHLASDHQDLVVSSDPAKLALDMGLSRREQKELRDLGLAVSGTATVSDVEITRLWLLIRNAAPSMARGFTPRDLQFVFELVDQAVDKELALFRNRINDMSPSEAGKLLDVVIPSISSIFTLLHQRRLGSYVQSYLESAMKRRKLAPPTQASKPRESASGNAKSVYASATAGKKTVRKTVKSPASAKRAH